MPIPKIKLCCITKNGVTCTNKVQYKVPGEEKYSCERHLKEANKQHGHLVKIK